MNKFDGVRFQLTMTILIILFICKALNVENWRTVAQDRTHWQILQEMFEGSEKYVRTFLNDDDSKWASYLSNFWFEFFVACPATYPKFYCFFTNSISFINSIAPNFHNTTSDKNISKKISYTSHFVKHIFFSLFNFRD